MSGKIKITLSITKKVRGKAIDKGTVILEGECTKDFLPSDVDKAIKAQEVSIITVAEKK